MHAHIIAQKGITFIVESKGDVPVFLKKKKEFMNGASDTTFRINGAIEFTPRRNILKIIKTNSISKIEPLLSNILVFLIENRVRTISREELQDQFWGADIFSDDALNKAISKIRKLLRPQVCIETVSKTGYVWVGTVERLPPEGTPQNTVSTSPVLFSRKGILAMTLLLLMLLTIKNILIPHH